MSYKRNYFEYKKINTSSFEVNFDLHTLGNYSSACLFLTNNIGDAKFNVSLGMQFKQNYLNNIYCGLDSLIYLKNVQNGDETSLFLCKVSLEPIELFKVDPNDEDSDLVDSLGSIYIKHVKKDFIGNNQLVDYYVFIDDDENRFYFENFEYIGSALPKFIETKDGNILTVKRHDILNEPNFYISIGTYCGEYESNEWKSTHGIYEVRVYYVLSNVLFPTKIEYCKINNQLNPTILKSIEITHNSTSNSYEIVKRTLLDHGETKPYIVDCYRYDKYIINFYSNLISLYGYIGNNTLSDNLKEIITINTGTPVKSLSYNDKYLGTNGSYQFIYNSDNYLVIKDVTISSNKSKEVVIFDTNNVLNFPVIANKFTDYGTCIYYKYDANTLQLIEKSDEVTTTKKIGQINSLILNSYFLSNKSNWTFSNTNNAVVCNDDTLDSIYDIYPNADEETYGETLAVTGDSYFSQEQIIKNLPEEPITLSFFGAYDLSSSSQGDALSICLSLRFLDQSSENIYVDVNKTQLGNKFFKFYTYSFFRTKQIISINLSIRVYSSYRCFFKAITLTRGKSVSYFEYEKGKLVKKTCDGKITNYRYDSSFRLVDFSGASELRFRKDEDPRTASKRYINSTNINGVRSKNEYTDFYDSTSNIKNLKVTKTVSKLLDGRENESDQIINNIEQKDYSKTNYQLINKVDFYGVEEIYSYNILDYKSSIVTNYYSSLDDALAHFSANIVFVKTDSFLYDNNKNISEYEFEVQNISYYSNLINYVELTNFVDYIETDDGSGYPDISFTYDNNCRLTSVYSGNYVFESYVYDTNGFLIEKVINNTDFNYSYTNNNLVNLTVSSGSTTYYDISFSYLISDLFVSNYFLEFISDDVTYIYEYYLGNYNNFKTVVIDENYDDEVNLSTYICSDEANSVDICSYKLNNTNIVDSHFSSDKIEYFDENLNKIQDYLLTHGYNFTTFFESSYFTNSANFDDKGRFSIFSLGEDFNENFINRDSSKDIECAAATAEATFIDGKPCAKYSRIYYSRTTFVSKYTLSFQFRNPFSILFDISDSVTLDNFCAFRLNKNSLDNTFNFRLDYNSGSTQEVSNISINENGWNLFYLEFSEYENILNVYINNILIYQYSYLSSDEAAAIKYCLSSKYIHFYNLNGYSFIRNILYVDNAFLVGETRTNYLEYSLKDINKERFISEDSEKLFSYKIDSFKNLVADNNCSYAFYPLKHTILSNKGDEPKYYELKKSDYLDSVYLDQFEMNENNIPMFRCDGKILAYSLSGTIQNTITFKFKTDNSDGRYKSLFTIGDINNDFLHVYIENNAIKLSLNGTLQFSGWPVSHTYTHKFGFTYRFAQIGANYLFEYKICFDSNTTEKTVVTTLTNIPSILFLGRNSSTPTTDSSISKPLFGLVGSLCVFDKYITLSKLQGYVNELGETNVINKYDAFDKLKIKSICKNNDNEIIKYKYSYENGESPNYIKDRVVQEDVTYGNSSLTNTYQYDKRANLVSFNNSTYLYNDLNEILGDNLGAESFSYDDKGNILTKTFLGKTYSYTYSRLYGVKNVLRLISKSGTPSESTSISYNASLPGYPVGILKRSGNFILSTMSLSYCGTRLRKVTSGLSTYTYSYDNDGIRWLKVINSEKVYQKFEKDRLVYEKATNGYEFFYHYDVENKPIGFTFNTGSSILNYFYIVNSLGIIEKIIDSSGNVVTTFSYGLFGNIISTTDTSGYNFNLYSSLRYKSYCYDNETNWYYLINRYYVPEWGRFLTPDRPENLENDKISSFNLYSYCQNNPLTFADPSGKLLGHFLFFLFAALFSMIGAGISLLCDIIGGNKHFSNYWWKTLVRFLINFITGAFFNIPCGLILNYILSEIFDIGIAVFVESELNIYEGFIKAFTDLIFFIIMSISLRFMFKQFIPKTAEKFSKRIFKRFEEMVLEYKDIRVECIMFLRDSIRDFFVSLITSVIDTTAHYEWLKQGSNL